MEKLNSVEITGLIGLLRQSGSDLTSYEPCGCGGSTACPYCEGVGFKEVMARYYMVDTNSEVADVILELGLGADAEVRLTRAPHIGILFAVVTEER